MSTIEAILVGSKRVKGCASKTKWKQRLLALTRDSLNGSSVCSPSRVILRNSL